MSRCHIAPIFIAIVSASPALAAHFTSLPGAPDPGKAAAETLLVSFDTPNMAGVTSISRGAVITGAGSIGGVRAAPAGTLKDGVYQSIGGGGRTVLDFSGWMRGRPLASASLYWGSVDAYNFVDFLDAGGQQVGGIGGSDLPLSNGNQLLADSNRRVYFTFTAQEAVTALRLRSHGAALEFDDVAAGIGTVPEPASWALLVIGFGCIGAAMRRRQGRGVAA